METRFLLRTSQRLKPALLRHLRYASNSSKPSTQQANPIGDYYASILESSTPSITSKPPTTATSSSTPPISTPPSDASPEPKILFSSRLSSPLERRSEIQKKSVLVAGVWVPPRPDEPDNCCMSGCVNCVWDRYRDELEEWAAARKEADRALRKEKGYEQGKKRRKQSGLSGTGLMLGEGEKGAGHTMVSMDDDGGGSETNWGTGLDTDFTSEDLFKGVPVGIREFMKQEKRLKEKHAREGTTG
jgi:Oxidoreductase-like protein, N-terminal